MDVAKLIGGHGCASRLLGDGLVYTTASGGSRTTISLVPTAQLAGLSDRRYSAQLSVSLQPRAFVTACRRFYRRPLSRAATVPSR
jgi:hypothetical protein